MFCLKNIFDGKFLSFCCCDFFRNLLLKFSKNFLGHNFLARVRNIFGRHIFMTNLSAIKQPVLTVYHFASAYFYRGDKIMPECHWYVALIQVTVGLG